jgi:hypothetical protein
MDQTFNQNYLNATTFDAKRRWALAGLANLLLWLGWLRSMETLSENQIVNLAGMLIPPIELFLILPLAIHQSQFIIRLAGLFMTPLSGIILIGARALLFMPVMHTCPGSHSRVNTIVNFTQLNY